MRARWTRSAVVVVGAAGVLVAMAPLSSAQEPTPGQTTDTADARMNPEARAHYERGLELYAAHRFAAAIGEFEAGHAIEPRREFLFAEAQAYRLLGNCGRAVPLYRQFLETQPTALQVEATQLALDRCARTPPAPAPPRAARASAGVDLTAAVPAPHSEPSVWRDPWVLAATAAAVTGTVIGAGLLVSARSQDEASRDARTHPEFERLRTSAERRYAGGLVALVAASWAALGGAARVSMLHRRPSFVAAGTGLAQNLPPSLSPILSIEGSF